MPLSDQQRQHFDDLVKKSRVVLFMKGNKHFPQCGFSAQVIGILKETGVPFETVNVLSDPAVRDGIKEYSAWPTIPQLYVDGEFLGGCDIVKEMYAAGDLEVVVSGVTVLFDKASAKRADGIRVQWVDTPDGGAFKIENPNEPARVKSLTAPELKTWIDEKKPFELFDVRTEDERKLANIEGARPLDMDGEKHLLTLDKKTPIVFQCHHGMRSKSAAERFLREGFTNVYNLEGGIEAWSQKVDPKVPRY